MLTLNFTAARESKNNAVALTKIKCCRNIKADEHKSNLVVTTLVQL